MHPLFRVVITLGAVLMLWASYIAITMPIPEANVRRKPSLGGVRAAPPSPSPPRPPPPPPPTPAPPPVRVATYNIWNEMFSFPVRARRIAELILESDADVVGLQEVRGEAQLAEIRQHLGGAYAFSRVLLAGSSGEGVALLSRLPWDNATVGEWALAAGRGPDTLDRAALSVRIAAPGGLDLRVVVTHLSYDPGQQCSQAEALARFVAESHANPRAVVIVLGDLNVFELKTDAVELLMGGEPRGICANVPRIGGARRLVFQDADAAEERLTFSNMPMPGLVCRPDRILGAAAMGALRFHDVRVLGDGQVYAQRFYADVIAHRRERVLASKAARYPQPCLHSCGPNGLCRQSVCISVDLMKRANDLSTHEIVTSVLREELFPSDHRLVVAAVSFIPPS